MNIGQMDRAQDARNSSSGRGELIILPKRTPQSGLAEFSRCDHRSWLVAQKQNADIKVDQADRLHHGKGELNPLTLWILRSVSGDHAFALRKSWPNQVAPDESDSSFI